MLSEHAPTTTLTATLGATPGIDAWQVTTTSREEAQLYLIGASEESRRTVADESTHVTIQNLHTPQTSSATGKALAQALGETTLTFAPQDLASAEAVSRRLREGALMASLTDNQPFVLPSAPATDYPSVELEDPELRGDIGVAARRGAQRLLDALRRAPAVRLGSAELFVTRLHHTLENSQGLRVSAAETSIFCDLALISGEGSSRAEFHTELRRRRLSDLNFDLLIPAYGAFSLHALHATAPQPWRGPVIVSGEAAAQLFNPPFFNASPFVAHTSAETIYRGLSRFIAGEFVTGAEPRGDRLTLASDARRAYGVRSYVYDEHGIPARTVALIEDGVFRQPWAEARYAQYLGVAPTGTIGNITVGRGQTPLEQLRAATNGPVYEVVAFSFFNPDPISGDFSAEIRLGYRYDASGVRPIKGGALVGNLFTAFGDARFSREAFTDGAYYGPAAIRFGELTITG